VLTDTNMNSINYKFKLTVTNSAPHFKEKLKSIRMPLNEYIEYGLPGTEDLEFNPVQIIVSAPPFIIFDSALKKLEINPTLPATHLGFNIIRVTLTDSRLTNEYKFSLTVFNLPPYFERPLRDIKLSLNSDFIYKLPLATDKENLPFRVSATMEDGTPLPPNIQYIDANNTFEIGKSRRASTNPIKICLDDNYASPNCYKFTIKFENIRAKDAGNANT